MHRRSRHHNADMEMELNPQEDGELEGVIQHAQLEVAHTHKLNLG